MRAHTSKRRRRIQMGVGLGPAWAVIALATIVTIMHAFAPNAGAAEHPRGFRWLGSDPEFIDAPFVTIYDKKVLVDGADVRLEEPWPADRVSEMQPLRARLQAWRERHATMYARTQPPIEPTVILSMPDDTSAAVLQSVDEAARAAGFTQHCFLRQPAAQ